jgi:hypothetical protein
MMSTPLENGCLACVYFAGQSLTLTKFAQQEAHTICEKWWIVAEEVEDNNYEEIRRSRPAPAAANLHSRVKPRVYCSAQALAHGGSEGAGLCMIGLDRHRRRQRNHLHKYIGIL